MLNTPTVRKLIIDGDEKKLSEAISMGEGEGMQSFTESFRRMVEDGLVDREVALNASPQPEALRMVLKGIRGIKKGLLS